MAGKRYDVKALHRHENERRVPLAAATVNKTRAWVATLVVVIVILVVWKFIDWRTRPPLPPPLPPDPTPPESQRDG